MAKKSTEILEHKIRQVIWFLKAKVKTKKDCCSHLGIAYNTVRLDRILTEFKERDKRITLLREKNRKKQLSESEKKDIVASYLKGDSINSISINLHLSYARVKKIIEEANIPLRSRGKNTPAKVEHIIQDLDRKFKLKEKVFFAKRNCTAIIQEIYDEDRIYYLTEYESEKYVDFPHCNAKNNKEIEGIHYEIYWVYSDGTEIKRSAVQNMIYLIEDGLIKYGREFYLIYLENNYKGYVYANRSELFKVE